MRIKIKEIKKRGQALVGQEVTVKGWIRTVRSQKNFTFLEVNDGSSVSNFQVILNPSIPGYSTLLSQLTTGTSIAVDGKIVESPAKGQALEMQAGQMTILGTSSPENYPLQKKRHSLEFLRTIGHLRPRTNTLGAVARVRSAMAYAAHKFFQEKGFIYIQTPLITASDCEGAGELFRVTTLGHANPPRKENGSIDYAQDFFGKPAYLTVSGQLNAEVFACSHSDVYTFGPTFRAENSNTSRHLAEFWMIEPEIAFADLNDNMNLAEEFIKYTLRYLLDNCLEDLEFFNQYISKRLIERITHVMETPFERASYTYAVRILEKSGRAFEHPVTWGEDLQSEHERFLAEEYFSKPVIITDYPKRIKPFYMRINEDKKTVANMDVLIPKIGEIIGGSQREERITVLSERMRELNLRPEDYWWYLELREFGSVPHSGYGVGFERFVQFATGIDNIRDAIAFPRTPGKAEF